MSMITANPPAAETSTSALPRRPNRDRLQIMEVNREWEVSSINRYPVIIRVSEPGFQAKTYADPLLSTENAMIRERPPKS